MSDVACWPTARGSTADRVFGNCGGGFTGYNCSGTSASSLLNPTGVAIDSAGDLYVADWNTSRVLEYDAPLTTDAVADRVFGQPNFTSSVCAFPPTASSLCNPTGVGVDSSGNLYVADAGNSRVLEYDSPPTTNTTADRVFGQGGSFATNTCNNGGITANSLCSPSGVSVDFSGNLYVADTDNHAIRKVKVATGVVSTVIG